MVAQADAWIRLRSITERTTRIADDITVAVVANCAPPRAEWQDERSTEYLSDDEANQLLTGLKDAGFRTRFFEGETSFISAVLARPRLDVTSPYLLVYNIAQSGRDACRKSLVPAFCALNGIPTCNSGAYAVSLARNKLHVHAILRSFGLPTPATWAYRAGQGWLMGERPPAGVTLIAKACHESASIGLDASSVGPLSSGYEDMLAEKSRSLGQPMVVQPFIPGWEVETPVAELSRRCEALGPVAVKVDGDRRLGTRLLDYETVARDAYGYDDLGPDHPADGLEVGRIASAACEVLGLSGFARVDFRVTDRGEPFVTDVSTSPHLVWHSSFSQAFRAAGLGHDALMCAMVAVNAARLGWIQPSDQTWMSDSSSPRPMDHQGS